MFNVMRNQNMHMQFGGPLTPNVKKLLIINAVIFLVQVIAGRLVGPNVIERYFGLSYPGFMYKLHIWQVFTYMFLHSTANFFHILFNMLSLWMFGGELEQHWGSKIFIKFYIICGLGGGFFSLLLDFFMKQTSYSLTIGASGAVFGIFLAFAMIWPNREIYVFAIFPIKVKYLVGFMIFIAVVGILQPQSKVSHIGHLGGLITAFFYIRYFINKSSVTKPKTSSPGLLQTFLKKIRLNKKKKLIDTRIKAKKIIDELLEKIARGGMSSLTPEEKKKLEWARKHYYPEKKDTLH